jgi:hypothetical protein
MPSVEFLNSRRFIQHRRWPHADAPKEPDHCILHIPRGMKWAPFDWTFGPGFAYNDVTALGAAARNEEKNHAIEEETGQEAQEGQENELGEAAQAS